MEQLLSVWNSLLENLLYINVLLSIIIVFFQRRDPKSVWTWLLLLYFIPLFGFVFYLIFAQDYRKNKMFRIKEVEDRLRLPIANQEKILRNYGMERTDPITQKYGDLILYNLKIAGSVLTTYNQITIITDGKDKFEQLKNDLLKAKHFIHIQYYIIKNDVVFAELIPILKAKAQSGVEVRILYDGMGSRFMPAHIWRELRRSGVKVVCFFPPILRQIHLRVNYRNHRKIVVIDGNIGYVGGFNVGKEYVGLDRKFGYWRDTHLRIMGDAVLSLSIYFALDWKYASKENLFSQGVYFLASENELELLPRQMQPPLGIQVITSGPDSANRQIRDNYLKLIHKAKSSIYIQTPYFVPDDAILSALKIAAQSGIKVSVMVPCKPDHPFVYWATYSYLGELIDVGAQCYTYENGFLHAKVLMVDQEISCVGTANMDIRSFELNFEVNATIYDEETTEALIDKFIEDVKLSKKITKEIYEERNWYIRFKEQFSRLLSPLL